MEVHEAQRENNDILVMGTLLHKNAERKTPLILIIPITDTGFWNHLFLRNYFSRNKFQPKAGLTTSINN